MGWKDAPLVPTPTAVADPPAATDDAAQPSWKSAPLTPTPGATPAVSGAPVDYTGWDTPFGPAKEPVPLQDDPSKTYGTILPFARDNKTGALEWAVPEILRAPIRGVIEGGQEARGARQVNDPAARADITAAVATVGGGRVGVGEPKPGFVAPKTSPIRPAAVEAREAGYVLPPSSVSEKPGMVSHILSGWSGKIKTQQAASAKNQGVTNNLAAKSLGLPPETVLTEEVFNGVRQQAGAAYRAVIDAVPSVKTDPEFQAVVDTLGGQNSQAAKAFPKITANQGIKDLVEELRAADEHPTAAWVEVVKELRFNANANLKAIGDPSKHALGLAQREAANAVDDMMERQIDASGTGVVDTYRAARRLIAKSYDIEGATNSATGDVSARGLARLADKGRPLTDELETIANAAKAFPKAMQTTQGFGDTEAWSVLDFFGMSGFAAHGNPGLAAGIMLRPVARSVALSHPFQNFLTRHPETTMSSAFRIPDVQQTNPEPRTDAPLNPAQTPAAP